MFKKVVASFLAVAVLGGCETVQLPNGEKIGARKACGDFSETKCAPLGSPRLPLNKTPVPLAVTESGPKVLDYLGMLGSANDTTGNRTYDVCGDESGRISPFKMSNLERPFTRKVDYSFASNSDELASVKADLISALSELGLSDEILDQLAVNVGASFDRLRSSTSATEMEFRYYRLNSEVMTALANPGGDISLESCRKELVNKTDSRLYKGLTGLYFFKSDFSDDAENLIRAELAALLKSALEEQAVRDRASSADPSSPASLATEREIPEGVSIEVERLTTEAIKISTEPYFRVLGLEFWRP